MKKVLVLAALSFFINQGNAMDKDFGKEDFTKNNKFLKIQMNNELVSFLEDKKVSVKSFDDKFNFSFGIPDHLVFSELSYDKIVKNRGLNVAINISSSSLEEAKALLVGLNFPIK